MKKLLLVFLGIFILNSSFAQNYGEWVWVRGNNAGSFGAKGVSSPANDPLPLYEACEWTDLQGNFWLYGGNVTKNDLWKYDPAANEWTWMTGNNTSSYAGNYGVQGVPSSQNHPPSKGLGVMSFTDHHNNLWMFAGQTPGISNDLWKYDISTNEWTWMKGPNTSGQPGVYGQRGVPNPANYPGCRTEAATAWTDDNGDLWIFGGQNNTGKLNDVWRFNIATNTWTWMKGSSGTNAPNVYGIKGVEDSLNTPGARNVYCRWKDLKGNFWMFGGSASGSENDMWRYNPGTNNWTWMSGDSSNKSIISSYTKSVFGTKCFQSHLNKPGARFENRAAWTDKNGNLWMFGGAGNGAFNELWMYCMASNNWTWVSGDSINPVANLGTMGVSSPSNKPGGKSGAISWADTSGNLYLFGSPTNELWKYKIDPECPSCQSIFTNTTSPVSEYKISIHPNPATSHITINRLPNLSKGGGLMSLVIADLFGRVVHQSEITNLTSQMDISSLAAGVYMVVVRDAMPDGRQGEKIYRGKLVKQ